MLQWFAWRETTSRGRSSVTAVTLRTWCAGCGPCGPAIERSHCCWVQNGGRRKDNYSLNCLQWNGAGQNKPHWDIEAPQIRNMERFLAYLSYLHHHQFQKTNSLAKNCWNWSMSSSDLFTNIRSPNSWPVFEREKPHRTADSNTYVLNKVKNKNMVESIVKPATNEVCEIYLWVYSSPIPWISVHQPICRRIIIGSPTFTSGTGPRSPFCPTRQPTDCRKGRQYEGATAAIRAIFDGQELVYLIKIIDQEMNLHSLRYLQKVSSLTQSINIWASPRWGRAKQVCYATSCTLPENSNPLRMRATITFYREELFQLLRRKP